MLLGAVFCGAVPRAVAEPLTVGEVVREVREAGGWGAELVSLRGTGSLIGVPQDVEMLVSADGDFGMFYRGNLPMSDVVIGDPLRGGAMWSRDLGGEILTPRLADADSLRVRALAMTGAWTREGALLLAIDESTGDDEVALRFTLPKGKLAGVIKVDRRTWRVSEWAYSAGDGERVVRLEGAAESKHGWYPARVISRGRSGDETRIDIDRVQLASAQGRKELERPVFRRGTLPDDVEFDAAAPPELEVKRTKSGHLLVRPRVNGQEVAWWLFDTGAGQNCIDTKVVEKLGLERFGKVPVNGIGGMVHSSFVRPKTLSVGPMTLRDPLMTEIDMSPIGAALGEDIGGIVGFNTIQRCVARVDMALAKVSLHDPSQPEPKGIVWTPIFLYGRHPIVEASFEGRRGLFKLDTGADNAVSFHVPAVEELDLLDARETTEGKSGGVGGMRTVRVGKVAWFELGGKRFENVTAEFATEKVGAFHDAYSLGNIGAALMRGFELVFDYQRERIGFVPRPLPQAE
jgi:hypothetical protein